MKQTVVQFLEEKLIGHLDISERYKKELFEQAEELFEKQIEKAFQVGMFHTMNGLNPKDYYNETFKTQTIVTTYRDGTIEVETFKSE